MARLTFRCSVASRAANPRPAVGDGPEDVRARLRERGAARGVGRQVEGALPVGHPERELALGGASDHGHAARRATSHATEQGLPRAAEG